MPQLVAFTCRRCGHCCQGEGGIVLAPSDVARLADHLRLDAAAMLEKYAEHVSGKDRLVTGDDHACIFYDQGCTVHAARPDVCRAWPFFRGNIIDPESHAMAAEDCPGISREASHAQFARQGFVYLQSRGLARKRGVGVPEALADIPPPKPEETDHGPSGFDAS